MRFSQQIHSEVAFWTPAGKAFITLAYYFFNEKNNYNIVEDMMRMK